MVFCGWALCSVGLVSVSIYSVKPRMSVPFSVGGVFVLVQY